MAKKTKAQNGAQIRAMLAENDNPLLRGLTQKKLNILTSRHPHADWKYEVQNGDTSLGFAEWLGHKFEEDQGDGEAYARAPGKPTLSAGVKAFFGVEIRNEAQGGVQPATLASALDSLEQAPDDVVAEWCGRAAAIHYGTQGAVSFDARGEIKRLIKTHGKAATLVSLL